MDTSSLVKDVLTYDAFFTEDLLYSEFKAIKTFEFEDLIDIDNTQISDPFHVNTFPILKSNRSSKSSSTSKRSKSLRSLKAK